MGIGGFRRRGEASFLEAAMAQVWVGGVRGWRLAMGPAVTIRGATRSARQAGHAVP
jgi:hypothetical protein